MASRFRFKKFKEVLSSLTDYTLTHTNKINDFTAGSAIETLYEAFSAEIEMFYYLNVENMKYAIWNSIFNAFEFQRQPQLKAYGPVLISFSDSLSSSITIASGTKFTSSNDAYSQVYETLDEYTIPAGVTAYSIDVYCTTGGTYGNIPAGVIDTVSGIKDVDSVVNTEAFQTGKEQESIADVRKKFRGFIQALQRGTIQAIQFGAMNVPNVTGVYVDEEPGYVRLYAHDANGDLSDDLRVDIQNELYFWRSAGVPVEVLPVHKTWVDMDITVNVPNTTLQTTTMLTTIGSIISNYVNSFSVGQSISNNSLLKEILNTTPAITDAQVNVMITPDDALKGGMGVAGSDSLVINEHLYPKSIFQPVDRTVDQNYIVSNPEDKDYLDDQTDDSGNNTDNDEDNTELTQKIREVLEEAIKNGTIGLNGLTWDDIKASDVNFALSTSNEIPGPDSYDVNPVSVATSGTNVVINYSLAKDDDNDDNADADDSESDSSMGIIVDQTYSKIYSVKIVNIDSSEITVNYSDGGVITSCSYYPQDSTVAEVVNLVMNSDNNVHGISIIPLNDQITFTDKTNGTVTVVSLSKMTMVHGYKSGHQTLVTIDGSDKNNLIQSDIEVGDNLHFIYNFTSTGSLNNFSTVFTSSNKSVTKTYYDNQGNTIRTDVYNREGVLTSSIDGDGNNLMPITTISPSGSTTTSTTSTTTTSTTSTTTMYPFTTIQDVSALDAPSEGYLPVFGTYDTASNEILKAGTVNITYKS